MNWLRKIGNWLWLNKERMVLGIMVCILIFRVYQVLNPPIDIDPGARLRLPGNQLPEGDDTRLRLPGLPPVVPPNPATEDWSRLWRVSPFTYRQPRQTGAGGQNPGEIEEIDLTLVDLREGKDGAWLARIRTASRTEWYEEGESFEQYNLQKIDPDAKCVTIFSEQQQKMLPVCME